jgi:hypothetical protein
MSMKSLRKLPRPKPIRVWADPIGLQEIATGIRETMA